MFCPKCGALIMPKKEDGKTVLKCSCGFESKDKVDGTIKEEIKKEEFTKGVADEAFETLPITEADCPKCKHKKAYFWEVQTRAADEAPTKFLKCEKCKHIWRDYN
jgi:DNA-directed RNA polymerase subunit M